MIDDLTLLSEVEFTQLYEAVAAETRRRNRRRDLETTLNTAIYTSLISDNIWSPTDYPAGWQVEETP